MAAFGLALALGCALWALTWQWMTVIDRHWWPLALWISLMVGWLVVVGGRILTMRHDSTLLDDVHVCLARCGSDCAIGGALAVRLLAVRDLAFPAWVDSSRHALITRLMALNGNMMDSYEPLVFRPKMPHTTYGFHTLSASFCYKCSAAIRHDCY